MHKEHTSANKIRISFFLPENLLRDVKEQMIKDGYDLKGKSKWIGEAVERLFRLNTFPELVKINDEMKGFERLDSVSLDRKLKTQLEGAIVDIRKQYPTLEGVQSRILRTAIVQRLLRGE